MTPKRFDYESLPSIFLFLDDVAVVCLPFYDSMRIPEKFQLRRLVILNPNPVNPILIDQSLTFGESKECELSFNEILENQLCTQNGNIDFAPCKGESAQKLNFVKNRLRLKFF